MTLLYINDTATIDDKGESSLPLSPCWWSDKCELYNKLESGGEVDNILFSFQTPTPEKCDDHLCFCLKAALFPLDMISTSLQKYQFLHVN